VQNALRFNIQLPSAQTIVNKKPHSMEGNLLVASIWHPCHAASYPQHQIYAAERISLFESSICTLQHPEALGLSSKPLLFKP
jgi:hypothetical protein